LARSKDGECDVPPLPPRSAKVFMQLASMFESGLWDSVATVSAAPSVCDCTRQLCW
jgi:hypothetical protein